MRTGILSDESIIKNCGEYQSLPMNVKLEARSRPKNVKTLTDSVNKVTNDNVGQTYNFMQLLNEYSNPDVISQPTTANKINENENEPVIVEGYEPALGEGADAVTVTAEVNPVVTTYNQEQKQEQKNYEELSNSKLINLGKKRGIIPPHKPDEWPPLKEKKNRDELIAKLKEFDDNSEQYHSDTVPIRNYDEYSDTDLLDLVKTRGLIEESVVKDHYRNRDELVSMLYEDDTNSVTPKKQLESDYHG